MAEMASVFVLMCMVSFPAAGMLPDPLVMEDGTAVRDAGQWPARRLEMAGILEQFEYGRMPPVPDVTVVRVTVSDREIPGVGKTRLTVAELAFGPDNTLRMTAAYWQCAGARDPQPAVLAIEPVWWEDPFVRNGVVQRVLSRGYVLAGFDPNALASYEEPAERAAPDVYPGCDWGTVAVAAWGCRVTMSWLESIPAIDRTRVGLFGHSRRGKSAAWAGALDERFAAVVAHQSGMAGTALYRVRGAGGQRLDQLLERYWLHPRVFEYVGREAELPFDQHWLHALIAPRPLLQYVGRDDAWGNPDGERAAYEAGRAVYAWLGAVERLTLHVAEADHVDPNGPAGEVSWECALDFLDRHFWTPSADGACGPPQEQPGPPNPPE